MSKTLFKFVSDEVTVIGPALKTLSNEVMGEPFKLTIAVFHLVVLCVKNDGLLNLFDVTFV